MKKSILILFVAIVGMCSSLMSQEYVPVIEAKVAPLKMILGGVSVSSDFVLNDNMSIEPVFQFKSRNIIERKVLSLQGLGKYYLNSKQGADRFYIGPYVKIQRRSFEFINADSRDDRVAIGLISGYKIVSNSGVVVDFTGGFGKNVYSRIFEVSNSQAVVNSSGASLGFDFISRISVGYRFGTVNESSNTGKLQRKPKLNRKQKSERRK